jgi:hypothetical protein
MLSLASVKSRIIVGKQVFLGLLAAGLCLAEAQADENPFGYTYTTDVLPKGKWEVEQWVTARVGKESGSFLGTDLRTEIELGFADRLQGSLYLNYNYFYIHDALASSGPLDNKNFFGVSGVSSEWKYQVLSPYKDNFGLTLYLEPGYATIEPSTGSRHQEIELEGKLILEKHWLDDALVGALNYTLEPEWEKADGDSGFNLHLKMEGTAGLAYRIAPRWYAGLEARLQTEFEDANLNNSQFVAAFVGPSLHYGTQRWWATLTVLPQVWGWPDSRGKGGLTLDDHERLEVRMKFGYNF